MSLQVADVLVAKDPSFKATIASQVLGAGVEAVVDPTEPNAYATLNAAITAVHAAGKVNSIFVLAAGTHTLTGEAAFWPGDWLYLMPGAVLDLEEDVDNFVSWDAWNVLGLNWDDVIETDPGFLSDVYTDIPPDSTPWAGTTRLLYDTSLGFDLTGNVGDIFDSFDAISAGLAPLYSVYANINTALKEVVRDNGTDTLAAGILPLKLRGGNETGSYRGHRVRIYPGDYQLVWVSLLGRGGGIRGFGGKIIGARLQQPAEFYGGDGRRRGGIQVRGMHGWECHGLVLADSYREGEEIEDYTAQCFDLTLDECANCLITDCLFDHVTYGVSLYGGRSCTVQDSVVNTSHHSGFSANAAADPSFGVVFDSGHGHRFVNLRVSEVGDGSALSIGSSGSEVLGCEVDGVGDSLLSDAFQVPFPAVTCFGNEISVKQVTVRNSRAGIGVFGRNVALFQAYVENTTNVVPSPDDTQQARRYSAAVVVDTGGFIALGQDHDLVALRDVVIAGSDNAGVIIRNTHNLTIQGLHLDHVARAPAGANPTGVGGGAGVPLEGGIYFEGSVGTTHGLIQNLTIGDGGIDAGPVLNGRADHIEAMRVKDSDGFSSVTVTSADSPYDARSSKSCTVYIDATAGNVLVNLPAVADHPDGVDFAFKRIDGTGNTVTLDADGTEEIDAATTQTLTLQNEARTLSKDADASPVGWRTTAYFDGTI